MKQDMLIKEVKRVMAAEGNYAAWYYEPRSSRFARAKQNMHEKEQENLGWGGK